MRSQSFLSQLEPIDALTSKMVVARKLNQLSLGSGQPQCHPYLWGGTIEPSGSRATSPPALPHTPAPAGPPVLQSPGLVPCAGLTGLNGGWK